MRFQKHNIIALLYLMLVCGLPQSIMARVAFVVKTSTSVNRKHRSMKRNIFLSEVQQDFNSRQLFRLLSSKTPSDDPECETDNTVKSKRENRIQGESNKLAALSGGVGEYDPSGKLPGERKQVNVGDPQIKVKDKEKSVTAILKELAAIQQQGPQKYCILGTRHCSYLHQQIIELLAYALVLSGNHVYTSGAGGTHAATIRGALRAGNEELLTVVIPQSLTKQPKESQELLSKVTNLVAMPQNDEMSLDIASRICNSYLLSQADQLISFAFHESSTVIEASKEAKKLDMLVTTLYLD